MVGTSATSGSMAILLTDRELPRCLSMPEAIGAIEGALAERRAGTAVSPPRTSWAIGPSGVTLTPGGFERTGALGLRVYLRGGGANDQLTAVWDLPTRRLVGLLVGSGLGAIRTGAIGGVAYRALAPTDLETAAVIGGGPQSRTQLMALKAVRPKLSTVRLYRRNADRRRETAERLSAELGLPVIASESVDGAVRAAGVVILATDSRFPVLRPEWLHPGAHVSSLGPKYRGRSEIGLDLFDWADRIVSDFPEQYRQEEDFLLHGLSRESAIEDLAEVVGKGEDRPPGRKTLFLSHGLAGTEVAVARQAFANAERLGLGLRIPLGEDSPAPSTVPSPARVSKKRPTSAQGQRRRTAVRRRR